MRETALVALGAAVAVALGWAGWIIGRAPDELAQAEVASTARIVTRDLLDHWHGLRTGNEFGVLSDGSVEAVRARAGSKGIAPIAWRPALQEIPGEPRAFVTLFREANRLTKAGARDEALAALEDALSAGPLADDAPALRLLELRMALAAEDASSVTEAWDRLQLETGWDASMDGRPIRLVAGWIAASMLDAERADTLRASLLGEGTRYVIGERLADDSLVHRDGVLRLEPGAETAATLALSESIWPGIADDLRGTEAWAQRVAMTLDQVAAPRGDSHASREYTFEATALGLCAVRRASPSFLVDEAGLQARLQRALPLPDGFSIGFASDESGPGEPLLDPFELPALEAHVQLYHRNPERLMQQGARRRRISAWSLGGLGLACIAAALIAARSLRRERRLAQLRSTFVAGISHDLRTPLASILLMADNLKSGRVSQDRALEYAEGIASEAERLRRRVHDVLDFSRIERGEPSRTLREDIDLPTLADEVLDEARNAAAEAGLRFEGATADLPPRAALDSDAFRRIVGNLVENALRHSGGSMVSVTIEVDDEQLGLVVTDDGCGIPLHDRSRVLGAFERSDTALNPKGGTGLGLAIVSGLVDAQDGTLHIDDGATGGARFTVRLPLDQEVA